MPRYDVEDPAAGTRRAITVALVVGGMIAGALIGLALTPLGKLVAGAPPATLANYQWNAVVFGVVGALVAPAVTWSALRQVPLWRAVAEPLAGGIAGAALGTLLGSGAAFLLLAPLGALAAAWRLQAAHRAARLGEGSSVGRRLPPTG